MLELTSLREDIASRPLKDLLKKLNKTDDVAVLLEIENHCSALLQRGHGDWRHGFLGWHDLHSLQIAAMRRRDRVVEQQTAAMRQTYSTLISPPKDAPLSPTERNNSRGKQTTRQSAKRTRDRARSLQGE